MFSYLKKKLFRKSIHQTPLLPVNTECTICLSNIDEPYKTKCNHYFHKECLDQWILIKSNCPNCRKSLKYLKSKSGICAECGRNVYQSYNRHPDGHLIYHKRCFQKMFRRNGRQL